MNFHQCPDVKSVFNFNKDLLFNRGTTLTLLLTILFGPVLPCLGWLIAVCTKMWLFLFLKEKGCHMFAGSDLIGQWCYYLPPLVNQSILSVFCYVIMSRQLFNYCEQTTFWRGLKHYALGFGANAAQKINSYSFHQERCDMEIFFSVRRLVLPQIQNFLGGNGRGHGPSKRQLRDCGFS